MDAAPTSAVAPARGPFVPPGVAPAAAAAPPPPPPPGPAATTTTSAAKPSAAATKVKKQLTDEQRAEETRKRGERRARARARLAAAALAQERANALEVAAAIQAKAKANAEVLVTQAATLAMKMLKEQQHQQATAYAVAASSNSSANKPPVPGMDAVGAVPSLVCHAHEPSLETGESIPTVRINLDVTPKGGRSSSSSKTARTIPAGSMPAPRQLFDETPTPNPAQDTQNRGAEHDTQQDGISIDCEPLFEDELPRQARIGGSRRTGSYTDIEDEMLCDAWLEIGQDAITGAKQKGTAFRNRIWKYFHEHRHFGDEPFESDRNENSLTKRWAKISEQCSKFCASYDHVKLRHVSDVGVQDLVFQALEHFKTCHDKKSFILPHCWLKLKDCEKWRELYCGEGAKGGSSSVTDIEGTTPSGGKPERPRGRTNTKLDAKREASSLAIQEMLKEMFAEKEVFLEKREERKRKEREVAAKNFYEIQSKMLEIEEIKARSRARKLDLKQKEVELSILAEENRIMTADLTDKDPTQRAWFEKKRKMILDRDA